MGNFNSCIYTTLKTATFLDPNGIIRQIELPITAAELMLDYPGHVIAPADQIRLTCRISAIKAEDTLSPGKLYLLVHPSRVHSKATSSDTALIDALRKRKSNTSCSSKVVPAATLTTDGLELTCHLPGGQWKPVLEPIFEEPRGYVNYLTRGFR